MGIDQSVSALFQQMGQSFQGVKPAVKQENIWPPDGAHDVYVTDMSARPWEYQATGADGSDIKAPGLAVFFEYMMLEKLPDSPNAEPLEFTGTWFKYPLDKNVEHQLPEKTQKGVNFSKAILLQHLSCVLGREVQGDPGPAIMEAAAKIAKEKVAVRISVTSKNGYKKEQMLQKISK